MKIRTDVHREYDKAYYAAHKEKAAAYYMANKSKLAKRSAEYYAANKEKRVKYNADRYAANRELHIQQVVANIKANPAKHCAIASRRRATKLKATPPWADASVISGIYESARTFSDMAGVDHHIDHIVPLRSKLVCGLHCEDNLRIITSAENKSKGNRYWPDMP